MDFSKNCRPPDGPSRIGIRVSWPEKSSNQLIRTFFCSANPDTRSCNLRLIMIGAGCQNVKYWRNVSNGSKLELHECFPGLTSHLFALPPALSWPTLMSHLVSCTTKLVISRVSVSLQQTLWFFGVAICDHLRFVNLYFKTHQDR